MIFLVVISLNVIFSSIALGENSQWVDPPPKYACPNRILYPCNCTKGGEDGIDLECSNTNLASLAIGIRQARTLINNLKIKNCNMEVLYGGVFTSLTVKRLFIEDTPIKDISDGTFTVQFAEQLEELHIRNSWLTRVPPSIKNLTNLKILDIEKSRIAYLPQGVFSGMNKLVDLKLADSKVTALTDKTFVNLRKLIRLSLFKNNITTLPTNCFKSQTNLEYLDISHNNFPKFEPHFFNSLGRLLWLNASHNEIPKINGRIFARNGLLRVLHLNHNNLTSLDANSLRGMRFMRRLYFSDNQITRVGRGTFRAVTRIGTVDLARNLLNKVDFQMFADLRFIDTIDLAENRITEVQREAFKNIYLTKVNLSHNAIALISEGVFRNCENMTFLDLSHNQLLGLDEKAFDEHSYTSRWILTHNNLTSMSQVPMQHQKGITVLNVSHNAIVDIPNKTFPKLFELHTIDFSHNRLSLIGRSVFTQLFTLRHLDFSYNKLEKLESYTFGKLPSLLDLDLSHNSLKNVRRGVFAGLSSVRSIQIHHNELTELPSPPISLIHYHASHNKIKEIKGRQAWPTMNSMLHLDFDYNRLGDSITGGRFDNLLTLNTLKLRGNNMTRVPFEALRSLQSLQRLYLDDNQLTNLTKKAFGRLPVVSVLGLSGNRINNVTTNAFEGLLQLVELDLSNNNLTYIPPGAFQSLVAVRNLDLSRNKLESLQNRTHGLFEDLLSLRKLDLSHNRIPFVTRKMFPENKWIPYKLEHVDLSHNSMPVLTKEILRGTKHLKYLNVSYNQLNDVRKYILGNLTSLRVLDISGNVLTDKTLLEDGRFGLLPNLTDFRLAHNKFSGLPIDFLLKMEKLEYLDVGFNRLHDFYPELIGQIKLGMEVNFAGNPLNCNCYLRPVAYWLASVGRIQGRGRTWDTTVCRGPKFLEGSPVGSVIEEQLVCVDSEKAQRFRLNPDVKFREVNAGWDRLEFSWYVNTNEDVGDFRLELRTRTFPQQTLFERNLPYDSRHQVLTNIHLGGESEELNLCLLVKNSAGRLRRWRQDQCTKVGPFSGGGAQSTLKANLLLIVAVILLFR